MNRIVEDNSAINGKLFGIEEKKNHFFEIVKHTYNIQTTTKIKIKNLQLLKVQQDCMVVALPL